MSSTASGRPRHLAYVTGSAAIFAQLAVLILFSHLAGPQVSATNGAASEACVTGSPSLRRVSFGPLEISL